MIRRNALKALLALPFTPSLITGRAVAKVGLLDLVHGIRPSPGPFANMVSTTETGRWRWPPDLNPENVYWRRWPV